jgi:S-adenosylmethionine-diacylgycerolhomoserine-N-methlytransferase
MPATNDTLQRFYRWNAPIYDLTRWVLLRGRKEAVAALALSEGDTVLEVGCGTGWNLARMRDRVGQTGCVVGVDLSAPMLARAARRVGPRVGGDGPSVALVRADAAYLPLRCEFDAVLMAFALTMIPDWRAAIQWACDCLRPGGTLVVVDFCPPNPHDSLRRRLLHRYLALNHVNTDRDIKGGLADAAGRVEQIPFRCRYVDVLRVVGSQGAWPCEVWVLPRGQDCR